MNTIKKKLIGKLLAKFSMYVKTATETKETNKQEAISEAEQTGTLIISLLKEETK